RDFHVTGVQTCALPIYGLAGPRLVRLGLPADGLSRGRVSASGTPLRGTAQPAPQARRFSLDEGEDPPARRKTLRLPAHLPRPVSRFSQLLRLAALARPDDPGRPGRASHGICMDGCSHRPADVRFRLVPRAAL